MKPKRKFTVVIEQDEEGFHVATDPALRGCHTQTKVLFWPIPFEPATRKGKKKDATLTGRAK